MESPKRYTLFERGHRSSKLRGKKMHLVVHLSLEQSKEPINKYFDIEGDRSGIKVSICASL